MGVSHQTIPIYTIPGLARYHFPENAANVLAKGLRMHFTKDSPGSATGMSPMLAAALAYADAGYSVQWLAPRSKRPIQDGWSTRPTLSPDDLRATYRPGYNVSLRCGHWSHPAPDCGLVVVDIDCKDADSHCEPYDLLGRLYQGPIAQARSGSRLGQHWYFACPLDALPWKANWTLAKSAEMVPDTQTPLWAIEILSTGKQVVAPPGVHPSGRRYQWLTPWTTLPPWPLEFMEHYPPKEPPRPAAALPTLPADDSIADAFRVVPWEDILTPHGWMPLGSHGDRQYWRRPGKSAGISATTTHACFYCFTSSTPFAASRGYSKFDTYAILEHGGDRRAAARHLSAMRQGRAA